MNSSSNNDSRGISQPSDKSVFRIQDRFYGFFIIILAALAYTYYFSEIEATITKVWPTWITSDMIFGWLGINALIIILLTVWHWLRFQDQEEVLIRDDVRVEAVSDLLYQNFEHRGSSCSDTSMYYVCALLSRIIYLDKDREKDKSEYKELEEKLIKQGWKISETVQPKYNSWKLLYRVWINEGKKMAIFTFRGTVIWSPHSWVANLHWFFKWIPSFYFFDQYDQVKKRIPDHFAELKEKHRDFQFYMTGHSLGGGLATHASYIVKEVKKTFVFNVTPVTGWSDIKSEYRKESAKGLSVFKLYERGEVLMFLRQITKATQTSNGKSNIDPTVVEHRVNFMKFRNPITQHGMAIISNRLHEIQDDNSYSRQETREDGKEDKMALEQEKDTNKDAGFFKVFHALITEADFPYVITVMIAIIGLGITSIVKSITNAPVVMQETVYVKPTSEKSGNYEVTLTNLTSSTNFKGLVIQMTSTNYNLEFTNPKAIVRAPGMTPLKESEEDNVGVIFTFKNLLPGVAVKLSADIQGNDSFPHLRVKDSNVGMVFIEPGFSTFLIIHETIILMLLFLALPSLIILRWFFLFRKKVSLL